MANANEVNAPRAQTVVASSNGWQVAWGVLLIICGILAVAMPGVAALATGLVFAWLLIFSGGCEMAYAFQTRDKEGFGWKLASGVLTLVLTKPSGAPGSCLKPAGTEMLQDTKSLTQRDQMCQRCA